MLPSLSGLCSAGKLWQVRAGCLCRQAAVRAGKGRSSRANSEGGSCAVSLAEEAACLSQLCAACRRAEGRQGNGIFAASMERRMVQKSCPGSCSPEEGMAKDSGAADQQDTVSACRGAGIAGPGAAGHRTRLSHRAQGARRGVLHCPAMAATAGFAFSHPCASC